MRVYSFELRSTFSRLVIFIWFNFRQPKIYRQRDSNPGPFDLQSAALPTSRTALVYPGTPSMMKVVEKLVAEQFLKMQVTARKNLCYMLTEVLTTFSQTLETKDRTRDLWRLTPSFHLWVLAINN